MITTILQVHSNFFNHYSSLNLIGHVPIPTQVTKIVPKWPDPPSRVLVMQYIQRCGGSGLVHKTI